MKKLYIILLLLCSSCAASSPRWESLPITVCTLDDIQDESIRQFNEIVGVQLFEAVDSNCGVTVEVSDYLGKYTAGKIHYIFDGNILVGSNIRILDSVVKNSIISLEPLDDLDEAIEHYRIKYISVFAHELGHALGFTKHSKIHGELMYYNTPSISLDKLIDEDFIEQIVEKYPEAFEE